MNHRVGLSRGVSLTALVVGLSNVAAHAQTFAAGDLVVYRVGDGSAALTSAATAVFLDEYNTGGTLIQSVALPTTTSGSNLAFTATGNAGSEGELNVSTNGQYLALTGYNAALGTTSTGSGPSLAKTDSTTVPRVIGIVGNGTIDTTTSTSSFSTSNIRGAYTTDGSSIYAVGANTGVVYTTKSASGAGTIISTTTTNLRDIVVSNSQIYVSAQSGSTRIAAVGTGTPTTAGQTTTEIPGGPATGASGTAGFNSPYAFFFATLSSASTSPDTLYFADNNAGIIDKFSLVGGSYVASGSITGVSNVEGLTGSVSNGTVNLYATTGSGIYSASDATGYNNSASGAATSIASAGTNTAFRGIAFLPQSIAFGITSSAMPEPGVLPLVAEAGALVLGFGLMRRRRKAA